jgi:hypothetical protein
MKPNCTSVFIRGFGRVSISRANDIAEWDSRFTSSVVEVVFNLLDPILIVIGCKCMRVL